jgi:hypothetical protein
MESIPALTGRNSGTQYVGPQPTGAIFRSIAELAAAQTLRPLLPMW